MIEDKGPGLSPLTPELLSFQVQPQQPQLEIVGIQLETGTSTGPDRWMPHLLAGAEENCYRPTKVILEMELSLQWQPRASSIQYLRSIVVTGLNSHTYYTAMVVKIRLARFGRKNAPFYNIVVAQARLVISTIPSPPTIYPPTHLPTYLPLAVRASMQSSSPPGVIKF